MPERELGELWSERQMTTANAVKHWVQHVQRCCVVRWWIVVVVAISAVSAACGESPSAPTQLSPIGVRKSVPGTCVDERDPCPDAPPTIGGSGGTGAAAPIDPNDPSAGFWPESVLIVYNGLDGSVMMGWATYVYSTPFTARYAFSAESFSTFAHESGGFVMTTGDRAEMLFTGSFSTLDYWVSNHSAGGGT